MVTAEYKGKQEKLDLLVVDGSGPSLLGQFWLDKIRLDLSTLHKIRDQHWTLEGVL